MIELIIVNVVAGLAVAAVAMTLSAAVQDWRLAGRVLRDAARALGLEMVGRRKAAGTVEGSRIQISPTMLELGNGSDKGLPPVSYPAFRIVVRCPGCIPHELSVSFAGMASMQNVFDPVFDSLVRVTGRTSVVLALLDYSTRLSLTRLVQKSMGGVERGTVWRQSGPHGTGDSLVRAARQVLDAAELLSRPGSLAGKLAANAARDAIATVQLRNLQTLLALRPTPDEAKGAALHALSDDSTHVRLAGATFLGAEGVTTGQQLALDLSVPDEVAAGALTYLSRSLPPGDVSVLLLDAARHRKGRARIAAIEGLGHLRHAPSMGTLAVLLDQGDAEVAGAAARALGRIAGTEDLLLRSLNARRTEDLAAVVDVLGEMGSIAAVSVLSDLARDGSAPSPLRQASRDAVRRIQARAPGAGTGQLAIAEAPDPEGALSLVDEGDPRGQMALTDEPVVRLL